MKHVNSIRRVTAAAPRRSSKREGGERKWRKKREEEEEKRWAHAESRSRDFLRVKSFLFRLQAVSARRADGPGFRPLEKPRMFRYKLGNDPANSRPYYEFGEFSS